MINKSRHLRRVVVTGIGVVSPLGVGTEHAWQSLLIGKCGVVKIEGSEYEKLPCQIGLGLINGKITNTILLDSIFSCHGA